MAAQRFADDAFPLIVAHRGASSTHPENTLSSFRAAIELGVPAIELDVRLTADGLPVVLHDPDVARTTDGAGLVHELTAEEVAMLNAGTVSDPAGVPTLREVLGFVSGRAAVIIEIKNVPGEPAYEPGGGSLVRAVLSEVDRAAFDGSVLIVSFDTEAVALARALADGPATGILAPDLVDPRDALGHVLEAGHDLVLPGRHALQRLGAPFVEEVHRAGVRVGTWTVDDPVTFRTLVGWNVDAVATNDPAMALAELAAARG